MDAHDIFVKLVRGAKFNNRKKNISSSSVAASAVAVKEESKINIKAETSDCNNIKDTAISNADNDDTTMTLLGTITASQSGQMKKRKKKDKLLTEDLKTKLKQEEINRYRNENNITVVGRHVAPAITSFEELDSVYKVNPVLIENLRHCGYDSPTAIQKQALPAMLQKRQILACAPTGSGKTAAFMVPLLHDLGGPQNKGFRAVILCPTRELAKQILRECVKLCEGTGLRPHFIYKAQQEAKKNSTKSLLKFDLLITTPKRLCFLLNQDPVLITLENVEWVIIDEADKLFEGGIRSFRDQLDKILVACSKSDRKLAMFSATHTPAIAKWARHNMRGLICITVGQRNTAAESVDQELVFVGDESGKLIAIRDLVRKGIQPPVLVFVQSKERAQELFTELIYDGINVDVIHADRTQTQRDNVVRAFREGRIWVLICTELMGRGVDFYGVNLVLNYDFPTSAISYIHRIGRTGRAGQKGKAITFYTQNDVVNLRSIAHVLHTSGCKVPEYMLSLKKTTKKQKKILQKSAPKRDGILTIPSYEKNKINRKRQRLEKANLEKVGVSSSDEEATSQPIRSPKVSKLNPVSGKVSLKGKKVKQKSGIGVKKSSVANRVSKKNKLNNSNGCID